MAALSVLLPALAPRGTNSKVVVSMENAWSPTSTEPGMGQSNLVLMLGSTLPAVGPGRSGQAAASRPRKERKRAISMHVTTKILKLTLLFCN